MKEAAEVLKEVMGKLLFSPCDAATSPLLNPPLAASNGTAAEDREAHKVHQGVPFRGPGLACVLIRGV